MSYRLLLFALINSLLFSIPVFALERLDDSLSPRQRISVKPQWAHSSGDSRREQDPSALIARIDALEIRLDTRAYVGSRVRIYMSLPPQFIGITTPAAVRIEWRARDTFLSGSLNPGMRAPIFDGVIDSEILSGFFDFNIHIDGRYYEGKLQFEPIFEIETL